jgi:predicted nucleic acid-binding protein
MAVHDIDANVLLRLYLKDVPEQFELARKLFGHSEHQFVLPNIALSDFVYALQAHYEFARPDIEESVTLLTRIPTLLISEEGIRAVKKYATHPKLSINDCILAEEAAADHRRLITFDHKLANQYQNAAQLDQAYLDAL